MQQSHSNNKAASNAEAVEQESFAQLLLEHMDVLYRTARYVLHNDSDAEDLVQDALLRALERRHLFRKGTNLKAWLLTILTRLCINRYHHNQRRPDAVSMDEMEEFDLYRRARDMAPAQSDPAVLVEQHLLTEDVQQAIEGLPDEFREVVVLCIVNELSYADTASALEIPIGTVRSRLSRGRALLRRSLWHYAEELR